MNKFKYIFYIIIIIGAFLLGTQTCNNTPKNDLKPITDTLIIHKVDTIRDTTTVFKFKTKEIPVYIEIGPTFTDIPCKVALKKRFYADTYKDSNLVVNINDTIIGYLTHREVNYKLYVPLKIYDSTTTTITKEVPKLVKPKFQLRAGIVANTNSANLELDMQINKITYIGGYDPFNKRVSVGLKYTLFTK